MSVEVGKYTGCKQIDSCSVRVVCKRVHHTPKTTFFDIFGGRCTCLRYGLGSTTMGAWLNRRDVQIMSFAQNYPVGLRRPRCAKNAPQARFLYASRPGVFESLLLRRICLLETQNKKSSHSWELSQPKWRRRRDSNPRDLIQAKRFSRPPHSTTLPPLRVG